MPNNTTVHDVVEMSTAEMLQALEAGELTSVDLVCAYLNRIAYYDKTGLCLHSVPVLNPECLLEAEASDARRRRGEELGPLEGVPFTVKDSYMVKGLTVASGSPALKDLIAHKDAATVEQLRAAGAVLIGKTNMPPMAAGGIQPGAYDYARSPYHPDYMTAAYGSGSSNGSGTATAASFSAFGMAEETVSSGRSPASNNSLVAYTPSRGLISIRGNWPLRPTCDVVVPHTRSVEDLLRLLDVVVVDDPDTTGDFWRQQTAVELPKPQEIGQRPFLRQRPERLEGKRFGIPKMYIGKDQESWVPPVIRDSVEVLWERARADLEALGAEVIECDFPVMSNYEEDRPDAQGLPQRGLVPPQWRDIEGGPLSALALEQFLKNNGDPELNSWADVDGDSVFPLADQPMHTWVERARGGFDWQRSAELVKAGLPENYDAIEGLPEVLRGLEEARRQDLEQWLADQGLDAVVFPAAGDVARDDLFHREESMAAAIRNGVVYSNGNRALRHLGIPTVMVPMGVMPDIQMPVGLTFVGAAYTDDALLDYAWAYEQASKRRQRAFLTPSLPSNQIRAKQVQKTDDDAGASLTPEVTVTKTETFWEVTVSVATTGREDLEIQAWADGHILLPAQGRSGVFSGRVSRARRRLEEEIFVVVKATNPAGATTAAYTTAALD
ncbi:amidase [Nesterenkonia sp. MY13]|uniref:Amidase n=1 Tax=Nesterenkonia sedimenti TaxID=1463632 RepID=A0A7X8TII7_9MICC|nr:amidase [Nesterenkonia sedimenti]NLS08972.1 amidase [Nesterenkonia sedimenti]